MSDDAIKVVGAIPTFRIKSFKEISAVYYDYASAETEFNNQMQKEPDKHLVLSVETTLLISRSFNDSLLNFESEVVKHDAG